MNLTAAIDCLGEREDFLVKRPTQGEIVKGRFFRSPPDEIEGTGMIWQATSKTLQMLPEGVRNTEVLEVVTELELLGADVKAKREADIINMRGADFEVITVADWDRSGGFFHAACVRLGQ